MRVLLTGGTGQVGTEFRRRAKGLDLLAPARGELDLSAPLQVREWLERERPQLILSVGAYTAVDRAEDEKALAHRVNAESVAEMAAHARRHDLPLVHLSTDYVFSGDKREPYLESDATSPGGVYGASKLAGEQAAQTAPRHLILRISWVFAAHGGNFVRTMLQLAGERDHLRVVDDQVGGPTWAGHVAAALRVLADRAGAGTELPTGTWHYGGYPHLSWHGFACELIHQAHARGMIAAMPRIEPIPSSAYPTRARRPGNSRLDSRRTVRELGLPDPDWREGLARTLDELARG